MRRDDPCYNDACEVLKNAKLFKNLDKKLLKEIVRACDLVKWQKGENIDYEIAKEYLFILIKGKAKLTQIDPNSGRSVALFLLQEGDIYDMFTLLDGKEHIAFPVPLEDCTLLRAPLSLARKWISKHPEFNEAFLPYLGDKMRELESFGLSLVFYDTTTRLANLILKHTKECEDKENGYPVKLINNLSHESLAELIGSVRAVVTMQLKKLKEEGTIVTKRGQMAVKNLEKLLKHCDSSFE